MFYLKDQLTQIANSYRLFIYGLCCLLLISSFCTTGLARSPRLKPASSSTAGQQLAQKILEAYGGEEKFKQLYEQGFHGYGKFTQISSLSGAANIFDVEIFNKGNKIREEMKVLGEPMIGGFDGKHSWLKQAGEVIEDNPTQGDKAREETEHGLQLLLKLSNKNTRLAIKAPPKESYPDQIRSRLAMFKPASSTLAHKNSNQRAQDLFKNTDILSVRTSSGSSTLIYADKTSHLVAATEFIGLDDEQGLPVTKSFEYEDYRPFCGSMMPYKFTEYNGGKKVSEVVLTSIKQEVLADTVFEKPAPSTPLLGKNQFIALPFDYRAGEIVIPVTVNGTSDLSFIVDTGATQSLIDSSQAAELGKTEHSDLSITTGSGSVPMGYMKINTLAIGSVVIHDIPVVVTDLSSLKVLPGKKITGMLGANILRQFLITFDFPHHLITFSNPERAIDYGSAAFVPAKPTLGGAGVMVIGELDGKKVDCLIDTGAAYSLIPYELAKQIAGRSSSGQGIVHGLDGKQVKVSATRFGTLKLGNIAIKNPAFFVTSANTRPAAGMIANGSVAILGNPIWQNYCLTIDYKKQRIVLSGPAAAANKPENKAAFAGSEAEN